VRKDRFLFELIVLALLGSLVGASCSSSDFARFMLPHYIKAKDKRKEREVKAGIRTIETALERYATDHDGAYPRYIWGGDSEGWEHYWRQDDPAGTRRNIIDPLIRWGYLDSYPTNPFVRHGKSVISTTSSNGSEQPGAGDPRFGFNGDIMGNGLSDPRFPEADDTLGGSNHGVWGGGASPTIRRQPGETYVMGGWWNAELGKTVSNHWPGCFFYRGGGDLLLVQGKAPSTTKVAHHAFKNSRSAGGDAMIIVRIAKFDRYLLGGYGSVGTIGYDALRIGTWSDPTQGGFAALGAQDTKRIQYYDCAIEGIAEKNLPIMFPETMGGGANLTAPGWPYPAPDSGAYRYASPDGSPDGLVIIMTAGSE